MLFEILFWSVAYILIAIWIHLLWLSKSLNMPKWEQIALSAVWPLLIPLWLIRKMQE